MSAIQREANVMLKIIALRTQKHSPLIVPERETYPEKKLLLLFLHVNF